MLTEILKIIAPGTPLRDGLDNILKANSHWYGEFTVPENTWFIATANRDDSTYTITDKVYDRAISIAFDDRNEEFRNKINEGFDFSLQRRRCKGCRMRCSCRKGISGRW